MENIDYNICEKTDEGIIMTRKNNDKRIKYACYLTNVSMAAVLNIVPLLFIPLRTLYGISYTKLGLLVVIGFLTQLTIDFLFSFCADKINVQKAIRLNPVLAALGIIAFISAPLLPQNIVYLGLVFGTVIFSAAGGLSEVLISPIIAALPSDNPERDMSKLHSVYAWGAVFCILVSAFALYIFGEENWQWIFGMWLIVPLVSAVFYFRLDNSAYPLLNRRKRNDFSSFQPQVPFLLLGYIYGRSGRVHNESVGFKLS